MLEAVGQNPIQQPPELKLSDEVQVELPLELFGQIMELLEHIARGHAVTITPVDAKLSPSEAATLLGSFER